MTSNPDTGDLDGFAFVASTAKGPESAFVQTLSGRDLFNLDSLFATDDDTPAALWPVVSQIEFHVTNLSYEDIDRTLSGSSSSSNITINALTPPRPYIVDTFDLSDGDLFTSVAGGRDVYAPNAAVAAYSDKAVDIANDVMREAFPGKHVEQSLADLGTLGGRSGWVWRKQYLEQADASDVLDELLWGLWAAATLNEDDLIEFKSLNIEDCPIVKEFNDGNVIKDSITEPETRDTSEVYQTLILNSNWNPVTEQFDTPTTIDWTDQPSGDDPTLDDIAKTILREKNQAAHNCLLSHDLYGTANSLSHDFEMFPGVVPSSAMLSEFFCFNAWIIKFRSSIRDIIYATDLLVEGRTRIRLMDAVNLTSQFYTPSDTVFAPADLLLASYGGADWSPNTAGLTSDLYCVAARSTGPLQFLAAGAGGVLITSSDGFMWTAVSSGTTNSLRAAIWSGSLWVLVGDAGTILTSVNGSDWTSSASGTSNNLYGIAWNGSVFAAAGSDGTILTSMNGSAWTTRTSGTADNLRGVAWTGSQFVAVGGTVTTSTSTDMDGNIITTVTSTSVLLTSSDGATWTARTSPNSNALYAVAASGSRVVAVGFEGVTLTSSDGTSWTAVDTGTNQDLFSVAWAGSKFVAVGGDDFTGGVIRTSTNGAAPWTSQISGTPKVLYSTAYRSDVDDADDDLFLAVGEAGQPVQPPLKGFVIGILPLIYDGLVEYTVYVPHAPVDEALGDRPWNDALYDSRSLAVMTFDDAGSQLRDKEAVRWNDAKR